MIRIKFVSSTSATVCPTSITVNFTTRLLYRPVTQNMPKRWKRELRREQGRQAASRLKQVSNWTVDDVGLILNSLAMDRYVQPMRDKEVDGGILSSLTADNLIRDLSFDSVDAAKLVRYVKQKIEIHGAATSTSENGAVGSGPVRQSPSLQNTNNWEILPKIVGEYKSAYPLTVSAGKAFAFPIPIETAGVDVHYTFYVADGYDINFQIIAVYGHGRHNECLFSVERQGNESEPVHGCVTPKEACMLVLEFHNSFSWVVSKKLSYSVTIDDQNLRHALWSKTFATFCTSVAKWGCSLQILCPHTFWSTQYAKHSLNGHGDTTNSFIRLPDASLLTQQTLNFVEEFAKFEATMNRDLASPSIQIKFDVIQSFLERVHREFVLASLIEDSPLFHLRNALFFITSDMGSHTFNDVPACVGVLVSRLNRIPDILEWGQKQMKYPCLTYSEEALALLDSKIFEAIAVTMRRFQTLVDNISNVEMRRTLNVDLSSSIALAQSSIADFKQWLLSEHPRMINSSNISVFNHASDFEELRQMAILHIQAILFTVDDAALSTPYQAVLAGRVTISSALTLGHRTAL